MRGYVIFEAVLADTSHVTGATPIVLSGELDQYGAEALRETMLQGVSGGGTNDLILDMTEVDHIDASALQVLLSAKAALAGRALILAGVPPPVHEWFRIAGADSLFQFMDGGC